MDDGLSDLSLKLMQNGEIPCAGPTVRGDDHDYTVVSRPPERRDPLLVHHPEEKSHERGYNHEQRP